MVLSATLPVALHQMADHVAVLQREPQIAARIKGNGVRIACRRVGHRISRNDIGAPVDTPDHAVAIAGVPRVAFRINRHRVGMRAGIDFDTGKLTRRRIESGHVIADLTNEPHATAGIHRWIARGRLFPRHIPLGEFDRVSG